MPITDWFGRRRPEKPTFSNGIRLDAFAEECAERGAHMRLEDARKLRKFFPERILSGSPPPAVAYVDKFPGLGQLVYGEPASRLNYLGNMYMFAKSGLSEAYYPLSNTIFFGIRDGQLDGLSEEASALSVDPRKLFEAAFHEEVSHASFKRLPAFSVSLKPDEPPRPGTYSELAARAIETLGAESAQVMTEEFTGALGMLYLMPGAEELDRKGFLYALEDLGLDGEKKAAVSGGALMSFVAHLPQFSAESLVRRAGGSVKRFLGRNPGIFSGSDEDVSLRLLREYTLDVAYADE